MNPILPVPPPHVVDIKGAVAASCSQFGQSSKDKMTSALTKDASWKSQAAVAKATSSRIMLEGGSFAGRKRMFCGFGGDEGNA